MVTEARRRAVLALWSVPGLGPKALEELERFANGRWEDLLVTPVREWLAGLLFNVPLRESLGRVATLEALAAGVEARAHRAAMKICFRGDGVYPDALAPLPDVPPLLFYWGHPEPARRRLAMVGSRKPDQGFLTFAARFASEVAQGGVGIVSGAAQGVDQACHLGALNVGGETWAFVGSSLDCLDSAQKQLVKPILDGGGTFFTELPPGARANKASFPRRNRLISGASDAVLVLRAGENSGTLITAQRGREQGRPVLAMPGDVRNPMAAGCNELLRKGIARACCHVDHVWEALRIGKPDLRTNWKSLKPLDWSALSEESRKAYEALSREPQSFEVILAKSGLPSAALTSALCELELFGRALQHPGKRYERV